MSRWLLLTFALACCACSAKKDEPKAQKGSPKPQPVVALADNAKHSLAKYLEVAGIRMSEKPGGKLSVRLVVINHSQAEINELALDVTTPGCTVPVKVGPLGPEESKDVRAECATKLRVYELPDWQFVRPTFSITAPAE